MEYADGHLEYRWQDDPALSTKIMDVLMTKPKKRDIALKNTYLKEESLVNFIDVTFKEAIEKDALEEKRNPSLRRYSIPQVHHWTTAIFRRADIKTYQIEDIYRLYKGSYPKLDAIHYLLADDAPHHLIPDYIFEKLLPHFYVENSDRRYGSGTVDAAVLREAMRRQMITPFAPVKVTVPPQQRPTTFTSMFAPSV
jgi:hypothetical protein